MFAQIPIQSATTLVLAAVALLSFTAWAACRRRNAGSEKLEEFESSADRKLLESFGVTSESEGLDYDYRAAKQVIDKVLNG